MVDAQESSHKFLSKNRWRTKFLSGDEPAPRKPEAKTQAKLDDDVNDFLKPSTEKAQAHKQAAAAAFVTNAKPRIDVSRAQRWPTAAEIISSGGSDSPGPGGLKTGLKKRRLTVSFSRTQPDIIGEGGDECEEPSIEVQRRRKARSRSLDDNNKAPVQTHQDDMNLGTRTGTFHRDISPNQEAARRGIVTRTLTSHGELSPELQRKMQMGSINTHADPPPLPPRGLGPMGLGERPKALQRAPTGFDIQDEGAPRQSLDSTFSYESDNISPVTSRKAPSLAPTAEEDEYFVPKPLSRTQTGWSEHQNDSEPLPPPMSKAPRLPDVDLRNATSPLDSGLNHFLESEPVDPNSYSARLIHKMREDEGRALHEAAARRESESSAESSVPGTMSSNPFNVGTPPSYFNVPLAGKTPPRVPPRQPPPPSTSPQKHLRTEYEPYRAGSSRGPSPNRRPIPESLPLDTDTRPPSSPSSLHTLPSATSQTRESPLKSGSRFSPVATNLLQRNHSGIGNGGYSPVPPQQPPSAREAHIVSPVSQSSIVQTPPDSYMGPRNPAPVPPSQSQIADISPTSPRRGAANKAFLHQRQESAAAVPLARSDTKSQAELAYADFTQRVQHMRGIFMLTAQLAGKLNDHSPMEWLRVACWWFLRGRAGMESLIRARPRNGEPQPERLTQPHVDLAKAWWIITEIIENHTGLRRYGDQSMDSQAKSAREAGDLASAEAYDIYDGLLSSLKMLLGSMKRHQSMPPTQALIQGQDQSIWVEYPRFAPDAQSVLAGTATKSGLANSAGAHRFNLAELIPLADSKIDFCYFRMFVQVSLSTDDHNTDRVPLPAIISVLRPREEFKVKLSICSQTELVNVIVGSNPDLGPTWRDVAWKAKTFGMNIQLRHGFNLNIEFSEADFRSLWAVVDHTNRVESNLRERGDERLSVKIRLRDFSYKDPTNPGAFPAERVKGCKLMVFQKFDRSSEGTGRRKLHRGYRMVVVTNTKNRTLSCVNHEMGTKQEPVNFEYTSDAADNAPGLILRFKEESPDKKRKVCMMSMYFDDPNDRNHLFGTFTSMNQALDEAVFAQVPLKAFSIESADQAEGFSQSGRDVLKKLKWMEAKALNSDPEAVGMEAAPTVMSESLRIVCRHSAGIISDRMNLGPGELLVRLPIDGASELTLLRNPQHDMAVAIDPSRTDPGVPEALAELLATLTNASTIRKLTFNSFQDLHIFQLAVTGFEVKFDGIASSLSISRRRMVVPIYKQWTANTIRIQIVAQDNIIQLLAFFEEFSHADAMNFQLKSMDVFEKIDKGGKACVRLVDAKFALPVEERRGEGKMGKEEGRISGWAGMKRKFVCLDQIEYPGEHDDILIAFDSAETRDRFTEALPAVAQVERKFTIRRKV